MALAQDILVLRKTQVQERFVCISLNSHNITNCMVTGIVQQENKA